MVNFVQWHDHHTSINFSKLPWCCKAMCDDNIHTSVDLSILPSSILHINKFPEGIICQLHAKVATEDRYPGLDNDLWGKYWAHCAATYKTENCFFHIACTITNCYLHVLGWAKPPPPHTHTASNLLLDHTFFASWIRLRRKYLPNFVSTESGSSYLHNKLSTYFKIYE